MFLVPAFFCFWPWNLCGITMGNLVFKNKMQYIETDFFSPLISGQWCWTNAFFYLHNVEVDSLKIKWKKNLRENLFNKKMLGLNLKIKTTCGADILLHFLLRFKYCGSLHRPPPKKKLFFHCQIQSLFGEEETSDWKKIFYPTIKKFFYENMTEFSSKKNKNSQFFKGPQ